MYRNNIYKYSYNIHRFIIAENLLERLYINKILLIYKLTVSNEKYLIIFFRVLNSLPGVYNMRCQMEYRNHVIRCQIQFFSYVKLKSLIIKEIKANILLIFVIYYLGHILHRGFYIEILFFYKNLCQTLDV